MKIKKIISVISAVSIAVPLISATPVLAATAVADEAGLASAILAGGEYELTADISAANAGINTATTGTINGNGHTITKSNSKWGDAVLYQNGAGNWTFSNMTIDGNKSTGTFTDAALWYMAGTVKFDNVTIQNFKTSTAARYAINCNSTANMTLNDVTFSGNVNELAAIDKADVYIDGGTLHLSGDTSAQVYYAGGSIDISGLTKNCDIIITASNAENYKLLKAILPSSASVKMTADDASQSVSYSNSGIDWALNAEKTNSADGIITVSVSALNFSDTDRNICIYAAAYDENKKLISVGRYPAMSDANSITQADLTLHASDSDTVTVYLWDNSKLEPLADKLNVTKIKEDNIVINYDFESPSDTSNLLYGGATVESGKGISGNGLVLNGTDGYMQLPNNIISENMTFMAWIKTDTVQDWARLFDLGADTSNNFFYSPSNGRVESCVNGTKDTMDVTAFANTGIWEHYAVTRTSNHVQLYRNGELISEADCQKAITEMTETSNYIGKSHYSTDKYFCGTIDEIKIYDKICTAEDIKAQYDKYAVKLSADAAYKDYCALDFGTTELQGGTNLPVKGSNGSTISWSCTDNTVISSDMTIKAPASGETDKSVTLTASVRNGSAEYTKVFDVIILAEPSIVYLSDYSMSDVEMGNDYLENGRDKMYDYLKEFDIDKCVSGFRRTAGLSSTSNTYGGWETSLIAGHAIGHYMSALAQGYNDTNDTELLAKSSELIDALYEAQIKEDTTVNGQTLKKGYLFATTDKWSGGAVVSGETQFDNIEANKANILTQAWVPWYTMHKILAGLVDTYKFTENEKALEMADALGTWVYNRVGGYTSAMQVRVLNIEYGGMNDVLYELYKITGDPNHAKAAHMFDEITLFDSLYKHEDILANKHANTTIPKIIGALNRVRAIDATDGKLETDAPDSSHDREYYLTVAENFWDIVVNDHSYITGGNSENEHFRAPHTENSARDDVNCETCNTYNMLKLSRELYKITGDKKYADYYENTYLNAIVSSQNPETGMTMYFQPMATGYYKVYSSEWDDFWCCTGSGMESFTKLTDSIYYKGEGRIAVDQYISSVLTDKDNNIKLTQNSSLPDGDMSTLTVEPIKGDKQKAEIILRIPEWTASAPIIKINGEETAYTRSAGYTTIEREWQSGDTIEITLPMEIRAYGLYDSDTVTAFKYGPVVLSVGLGKDNLGETSHGMAVRKPKTKADVNEYVIIDSDYGTRDEWLANVNENMVKTEGKLEFTMQNTNQALVFTPHYKRYDERYGIYWYVTGMTEEEQQEQILKDKEDGRDENIIIDSIELSHDQQENGHGYTQESSTGVEGTGTMTNYREILSGGYVDYQMAVNKDVKNYISVTYNSGDAGRKMSIYAADTKIAEVTASGKDETVLYEIPQSIVETAFEATADTIRGKDALHIIFRADCGTDAPKLCGEVKIVTDYGTDPSLSNLIFDIGTLSPEFNSEMTEYTLTVPSGTSSVSLTATLTEKYGLVYVNGILINDLASKIAPVSDIPILITTYAENHETSRTYTVILKTE